MALIRDPIDYYVSKGFRGQPRGLGVTLNPRPSPLPLKRLRGEGGGLGVGGLMIGKSCNDLLP